MVSSESIYALVIKFIRRRRPPMLRFFAHNNRSRLIQSSSLEHVHFPATLKVIYSMLTLVCLVGHKLCTHWEYHIWYTDERQRKVEHMFRTVLDLAIVGIVCFFRCRGGLIFCDDARLQWAPVCELKWIKHIQISENDFRQANVRAIFHSGAL